MSLLGRAHRSRHTVQVEHTAASASCKVFANLVSKGSYPCVFDRDLVERLQAVYDAKRFTIFLDDAEPLRSVRRVGWLIHTRVELAPDDLAYFFVDSGRNGDISLHPQFMWDCRNLYWREEVLVEVSVLQVGPGEPFVLKAHEVVHERALFR